MSNFIKKVTSEFFYGIFASTLLFLAMFIFVLLVLMPFICAIIVDQYNPGIHPAFVFATVFIVAYIEYLILGFIDYAEE